MSDEEYEVPEDLLYISTHEWIKQEDGIVVIGITDYAQKMLHEIVYVELPKKEAEVSKGESFMSVESIKAVSDIYAPVSGKVVEVNSELESYPEKVNEAPYGEGWLVKIKASAWKKESGELLGVKAYKKVIEEESR